MAIGDPGTASPPTADFRSFFLAAAAVAVIGVLADLSLAPGTTLNVVGVAVDLALAVVITMAAVRAKQRGKSAALISAACGAVYGLISGLATLLLPGMLAAEQRALAAQPVPPANAAAQKQAIAFITSASGRTIELVLLVIGSALLAMVWGGLVSLFVRRADATQI